MQARLKDVLVSNVLNSVSVTFMRPDSPRDFGAIQIIYLLTYLCKCSFKSQLSRTTHEDLLDRVQLQLAVS